MVKNVKESCLLKYNCVDRQTTLTEPENSHLLPINTIFHISLQECYICFSPWDRSHSLLLHLFLFSAPSFPGINSILPYSHPVQTSSLPGLPYLHYHSSFLSRRHTERQITRGSHGVLTALRWGLKAMTPMRPSSISLESPVASYQACPALIYSTALGRCQILKETPGKTVAGKWNIQEANFSLHGGGYLQDIPSDSGLEKNSLLYLQSDHFKWSWLQVEVYQNWRLGLN